MDTENHNSAKAWIRKTIQDELTPQGDLLPPWIRYPDIECFSIGWRMGSGESYIMAWGAWAEKTSQEKLVEYFRKYMPIPFDWLAWVADSFGDFNTTDDLFSENGEFKGIHWLEEHGLAKFSDFKQWFDNWNIE